MSTNASDKPQKISIGFAGGQSVTARVRPSELAKLRAALGSGGWYELAAEDSTLTVGLDRIDYVLVDQDAQRVGF